MLRNTIRYSAIVTALVALALSSGCRKKAYENPIATNTQQPDKKLFDTAIDDVEHGRYERARLELQAMMNTYDTSEYLAKAKLAVADSWYREGGAHGFAQAELEYKDFILFYPTMEEAAEAQQKICTMQFQQMDKADRDPAHAMRAEDECRQLLVQFPNSKFAPNAAQMLRDAQEVLAAREFNVGTTYHKKGSFPASANRLNALTDQFPLFSRADDALWMQADAYRRMGDRFEEQQAAAYAKIVKDYPLSSHVSEATAKLEEMKRPVPQADPVAYSRMKYEIENRQKRSLLSKVWGPFSERPNTNNAAKSGTPQMTSLHPTIPASVPATAGGPTTSSDVSATTVGNSNLIDNAPDARTGKPGTPAAGAPASGSEAKPADSPATGTAVTAGTAAPAVTTTAAAAKNTKTTKKAKTPKKPKPSKKDAKKTDDTVKPPDATIKQ